MIYAWPRPDGTKPKLSRSDYETFMKRKRETDRKIRDEIAHAEEIRKVRLSANKETYV
ncbi:hypothetical protein P9Y62_02155 [Bacillus thuringiensis]|uniref:hypothetical protein n=1 Tax=Bacillus cereus group TaxID=86661 RepID=UPI0002EDE218|nr:MULTISPECIES: hypothetical protein [Bacillus cereus group]HDR7799789.1 hypothetical protein [Bacillus tropicus]MBY0132064.1 hypothetical protein [Bacillus cereus]MDA2549646.1 hypothetical protein [Bacillus cereus]MDA2554745.1 hypothetical protein [Bacillus cereus]MDA2654299.1 hypothetical protein [Bacillus cereus]